MNRKLSIIFLILCFGNIFASAQSVKEPKSAPTGLTLEVTFIKGRPPAYLTVGDSLATARSTLYGAYTLLPNFQTSAERPPVQAVKIISYLENGAVKVKTRVFTGQKSFEKEEDVAEYSTREGERISVKELANFGVEPFEIAVIRIAPSVSTLPTVENKTKSLQVTAIEPNFSTLPSYKLNLLNTSNKAVSAYTFEMMVDSRVKISGMPQNKYGKPLIEAGETWVSEMRNPLEYKQPVEGETPKQASRQTLVISSVIFADGSYEGNDFRAAQYRAYTLGRKTQVKQIIALLDSFEDTTAFDFNKFVEQSAKLETKIGEQSFGELLKQFPTLSEQEKSYLREGVEDISEDVKIEFTSGTKERLKELAPIAVPIYLKALRGKYQDWLALLP
ncbi:MAG: hypothetical protein ACR2HG_09260 [Pyrinomonadaceae bacterium]